MDVTPTVSAYHTRDVSYIRAIKLQSEKIADDNSARFLFFFSKSICSDSINVRTRWLVVVLLLFKHLMFIRLKYAS